MDETTTAVAESKTGRTRAAAASGKWRSALPAPQRAFGKLARQTGIWASYSDLAGGRNLCMALLHQLRIDRRRAG